MKKIIMTIGAFALMTFSCKSQNWKMNEAVNTLADMEEWMQTDIANGYIKKELGEEYLKESFDVFKILLMFYFGAILLVVLFIYVVK